MQAQLTPQELQSNREEIRRRQEQEQAEQQARLDQPRVNLEDGTGAVADDSIPEDPNGFRIDRVEIDTAGRKFTFLPPLAKRYEGKRLGQDGLQHALKHLTNAFIERGYVTTRVLLPEQDLTNGTLKLVVVPGVVGKVGFTPESPWWGGTWWNAFPTHSGKMLNIRDVEQGLEQMKRVPTQDVAMDLKPGAQPGESDVVITQKNKFPIRGTLSVDNSGDKKTGEWQGSATASWDNPLFLNDLFSFTYNGDVETASGQGTNGNNIAYSIPFGYWIFFASYNVYDYHQTVQGALDSFVSSGKSRSIEGRAQYLIHRNQNSKTSAQARLTHRKNSAYIDGTEVEVQRRDTTALEIALMHQRNWGSTLLDCSVAWRTGVHWFGAQDDPTPYIDGAPTNYYNIWTADLTLRVPFALGPANFTALTSLRGQYTPDALFGSEYFSIGNRYTVRGFDGGQTLGAERGITLRNELAVALWETGQWLYAGIDYGCVYGPADAWLPGHDLLGAVVGVRGGWQWFFYDATVGCPLYKPDGFRADGITFTVQAGLQF